MKNNITIPNFGTIALAIALIVVIFTKRNTEIEQQSRFNKYLIEKANLEMERDRLRYSIDSILNTIQHPKQDTTIINNINVSYEESSNNILLLSPNDKVRHLSEWLSQADSLRR
jgi:hypothetical protein